MARRRIPADACTGLNCPQAEITEDGVIAQARAEMNELNAGYPGGPPPTNCTDEHELVPEDGNDIVEYHGIASIRSRPQASTR